MATKIVCGVGINDSASPVCHKGFANREYTTWCGMLMRCYSTPYQRKYPTYVGCAVCEEWLIFSNFQAWHRTNYKDGFELDKDLLVQGNKIYSPQTCRFVPHYINSLFLCSASRRGRYPVGVTCIGNKYQAACRTPQGEMLTKRFDTVDEASYWYKTTKTRIVKEQATRAFLDNAIKTDMYLALVRRKF